MRLSFPQAFVGLPSRKEVRKITLYAVLCCMLVALMHLTSVKVQHNLQQSAALISEWAAAEHRNTSDFEGGENDSHLVAPSVYPEIVEIINSANKKDVPAILVANKTSVSQEAAAVLSTQYCKDKVIKLSSNWTEEKSALEREVLLERRRRVSEVCRLVRNKELPVPDLERVYDNMIFAAKHSFIWCPIFKAASTTWMKHLLQLSGKNKTIPGSHRSARRMYRQPRDPALREHLLRNALKMIIVRHPLERLLSAYRDKMLRVKSPNHRFEELQRHIAQRYPDSSISLNTSFNVNNATKPTFTQFLKKVIYDLKQAWKSGGKKSINMHWRPYWLTCAPCQVSYDVIAQVETLDLDQEYVIRQLGLQDQLFKLHTHASNFDVFNGTRDAVQHYYSQVPLTLLNEVVQYYKQDFDLFGYSPDPYYL
nr:carbohydrate sulfotransferase 10-like [Cherax quadricarinatus]